MVSLSSASLDNRVPQYLRDIDKLKANRPISIRQVRPYLLHQNCLPHSQSMATIVNGNLNGETTHHSSSEAGSPLDSNQSAGSSPPFSTIHSRNSRPDSIGNVIKLSSIDHCMPRAYIRVCLAYRLPDATIEAEALGKLKVFVKRIVHAKPYLSGYVMASQEMSAQKGKVEIRFTVDDFDSFPDPKVRRYSLEEMPYTYAQLDVAGLPPSVIKPELVSALPEAADQTRAPVFRVQANIVEGGMIVSFYLHHCISDGTGLGLLISGKILDDDFTFELDQSSATKEYRTVIDQFVTFAKQKSEIRERLSWSPPNILSNRRIQYKVITSAIREPPPSGPPGRGCIFTFCDFKLDKLKSSLESTHPNAFFTKKDVMQAFIWHHMTLARLSSLPERSSVTISKLLIPVSIRSKIKPPLSEHYFGSAVDFASTELAIEHLLNIDPRSLASTAIAIRKGINAVDDAYVRSAIALANSTDPKIDVCDLQASNMNRVTAADMYITSWEEMPLYNAELDLGLGPPDWVRKPWSRDPGSCIILPKDPRKPTLEVVVQMTEADMGRLLEDEEFMAATARDIIE